MAHPGPVAASPGPARGLARRLGTFDLTMIVMGGIIGSGIFVAPSVVARQVQSPALALAAWVFGGVIALIGAFIYAELAARRPHAGGQYAYLREAYHPMIAFLYGWGLLLVVQSGGMAAGAVVFSRYVVGLGAFPVPEWAVTVFALAALTVINALGVRAGSGVQSGLMVLKIVAILGWIAAGFAWRHAPAAAAATPVPAPAGLALVAGFATALVPVLFSCGGGHTATFVTAEVRDPVRTMPRALVLGVGSVIALYLAVHLASVSALGISGLAATDTPARDILRGALGETGARLIAAGIAISTLGFLSQSMLTAPRVYHAMAEDGSFFRGVARVHPVSQAPVVAITLQGAFAILIALSGRFDQILSYVVSTDWIFFAITAASVFILRRRDETAGATTADIPRIPGHPWTTLFFVAGSAVIVLATAARFPVNAAIGIGLLLAGIPAYFFWRRSRADHTPAPRS